MYRVSELASEGWTTMVFPPRHVPGECVRRAEQEKGENREREDRHQQGVEKSSNQVAYGTQGLALEDAPARDEEVAMGAEVSDELGADGRNRLQSVLGRLAGAPRIEREVLPLRAELQLLARFDLELLVVPGQTLVIVIDRQQGRQTPA